MVHQYKNNGYNIVMDICSGAIHVVDDVAACIDWCLDYNRQHHAG